MYKPEGYTDLSPYLVVEDAEACVRFIADVFGTEPLRLYHGEDGAIMHCEIAVGDSVLMLGQMKGGNAATLHLYLPDAESKFERALSVGGQEIKPFEKQPDGDKRGGVRAPCGTMWFFATQSD